MVQKALCGNSYNMYHAHMELNVMPILRDHGYDPTRGGVGMFLHAIDPNLLRERERDVLRPHHDAGGRWVTCFVLGL
jgi:hypothetical protein